MTVLDDAITLYRAAATLLSNVSQRRIDLLRSAGAAISQPKVLFEGHRSLGPHLEICVPRGARATFALPDPRGDGAVVETDLPEWLTLEGWLPADTGEAEHCFIEIEAQSDEAVLADAFIREIDSDHAFNDAPPTPFQIQNGRVSVLKLDLPKKTDARRKVVLHLRRPPAELFLRQFAVIPV